MFKRIMVAVVFVPLILVVMLLLPSVMTAIMVALISALACYELLRAVENTLPASLSWGSVLFAGLVPLFVWAKDLLGLEVDTTCLFALLLMLLLFVVAISSYQGRNEVRFDQIAVCLFGGILMPTFLGALVQLRVMEHGKLWVLLPFVLAFLTDGGAYFAGVFLGKHRGITRVSPNKSLEGYIGGIATGVIACLLYGVVVRCACGLSVSFPALVLYGAVGAVITALGDLSFSLVKRQHGVKDYGNLLPGHGGMLDRFDSMIFAAPAVLVLMQIFPAF